LLLPEPMMPFKNCLFIFKLINLIHLYYLSAVLFIYLFIF
jgi:hypothetical protein